MGIPDCKINPDQPADCPPSIAQPAACVLYRALKGSKAVQDDFKTEAEKERSKHLCLAWGLSVWTTKEGVEKARNIVPGFRKKCIILLRFENPKILRIDDAEIICDRITMDVPVFGHLFA
jgi:hypothetical protein